MKDLIVILTVLALLAGCATTTVSSIGDVGKAQPNKISQNGDGSRTFEFYFKEAEYNQSKAGQRILEYLDNYAKANGFAGYDLLGANGEKVDRTRSGDPVAAMYSSAPTPSDPYIRVFVRAKFKTS